MKRVKTKVVGFVAVALLVSAGYLLIMHARQAAIDQEVKKLAAAQVSPADLAKIESLSGSGAKFTTHEELLVAGAYSRVGNDDKALDWYKHAASDSQDQSLPIQVESQEALAHFYSVKTDPDIQACGSQYNALRSSLIANGSSAAQPYLVEVDMLHAEDLITYARGYARMDFMQASADLTQANDLLWRALSRCKSAPLPKDERKRLQSRIQADQELLSKLVQ